ncbi:uncharacterized protein [Spinacia oleracea]|uniref:Retrotransposon Copia-like N-terminal domain-containing protein n=1 Tax=Spinacia oleracea TaxID=3562 RepID=A0ABM3QWB3_SPIOL|nr:uncharacterized protein LOC110791775 [Spinacia oleracea]
MTTIETTSPLYLHPSDGSNSINIEKLQGSSNYRSWRRSLEISLGAKRKLGFVTGAVKRDSSDAVKQDHWDTCNNMLEQRCTVSNGSRKYKICKDIYETKQQGKLVSEYYTEMRALWEELEALNIYPPITTMTPEINAFISALNQQQEEQKLFQFLNGLDDGYSAQRSQLLMMTPLPTVDSACSCLQQEESQRDIHRPGKEESDAVAMYSKSNDTVCSQCAKPGHTKETCWFVVGYPSWHPLGKKDSRGKGKDNNKHQGKDYPKTPHNNFKGGKKWNKGKGGNRNKMAANAHTHSEGGSSSVGSTLTTQQLEQLLKLLPIPSKAGPGSDTEDEMDTSFAGMVSCYYADATCQEWIIDTGASHHMTGNLNVMLNPERCEDNPQINLPTGQTSDISHTGSVKLHNYLELKNVLCVPAFKHNLLSVKKLAQDGKCKVIFHSDHCMIQDQLTSKVIVVGTVVNGLYYLINEPINQAMRKIAKNVPHTAIKECRKTAMTASGDLIVPTTVRNTKPMNATTLWHHRLGHAPLSKINKIQGLKEFNTECHYYRNKDSDAVKDDLDQLSEKLLNDNEYLINSQRLGWNESIFPVSPCIVFLFLIPFTLIPEEVLLFVTAFL